MSTPPLLLAAAILLWGWLGEHLAIAVVLAAILEAPRVVRARFTLTDAQQRKVVDYDALAIFAAGALFAVGSGFPRAIVLFFEWLPVLLLPIALVQAYGTQGDIDLRVLFWSLRQRDARVPRSANVAYPYTLLWVIAASATGQRGLAFDVGIAVLLAWALWPVRARSRRAFAWAALVATACALGYAGGLGLRDLQLWLEGAAPEWLAGGGTKVNPYRGTTDIGRLGQLKMSDAIVLRVRSDEPLATPVLLHQASYNDYVGVNWLARGGTFAAVPRAAGGTWPLADRAGTRTLSIDEDARHGDPVLSLPAGATAVEGLAAKAVKRNPLGAVQAEAPPGFVAYRVRYDSAGANAQAPAKAELSIPEAERETLERVAREWGLLGLAPEAVIAEIRRRMLGGFRYATFQSAPPGRATPLSDFLLRSRSGHCEHFASATTLLLRAAGVPSRYATGYSLQEWSALEGAWIARERHSHAWSRAFIDGRWIDVDTTPPVWLELETEARPAWAGLGDRWAWLAYRASRWMSAAGPWERGAAFGFPFALVALALAWRARGWLRLPAAQAAPAKATATSAYGDSAFTPVARHLEAAGFPRGPAETVQEWVARVVPRLEGDGEELRRLAALHYRWRYDPEGGAVAGDLAAGAARWIAGRDVPGRQRG